MAKFRKITIDFESSKSYSQQIFDHFCNAIQTGTLLFGYKLPSIRDLSAELKINKIGIITAYNKLSDGGFIKAKLGSGFYVSYKKNKLNLSNAPKRDNHNLVLKKQQMNCPLPHYLDLPEDYANLGGNQVYKSFSIMEELRAISRTCFSNQTLIYSTFKYNSFQSLKEIIGFDLENKGMPISNSDQILLTCGEKHAIDIILNGFLNKNDYLVLESPNSDFFFYSDLLKKYNIISIERSFEKLYLTEEIISEIKNKKPKAFIIYTNCHCPTGGSLTAIERHSLIKIAKEINAIIIEIDIYSDLNYDEFIIPNLATIEGLNNSFYISGYSKVFAPGLKIAYVVSSIANIKYLNTLYIAQCISPSIIDQQIIYELIIRGVLKKHTAKLKNTFRSKRDTLIAMLKKLSPQGSKWNQPDSGMYLWFEFPPGENLHVVEERALEKKISIAPGYYFSKNRKHFNFMRINFANLEPVLMYNSLETLFSIWRNASSRKWIIKNDRNT